MSTRTGFEFDQGAVEVLIVCHDCAGEWRAFAWSMGEAETRAAAHEKRCHPKRDGIGKLLTDRHAQRKKRGTNL